MSDVIPRNFKKMTSLPQTVFLASTNAEYTQTHTQTHTHTQTNTNTHGHTHVDSNRRNAMRCISPKNEVSILINC